MANWYGTWRTNYVRFRPDRFDILQELFCDDVDYVTNPDGTTAILADDSPTCYEYEQQHEFLNPYTDDEYLNLCDCIHEFLEPGEVLITMCAGAEKQRYITGVATAYTSEGLLHQLSLNDIYDKVPEGTSQAEY
jgi:hypothetical protein